MGYQISPLLWEKVRRGLSAGRVQSVAVRMICERDQAIKDFKPDEYWSIIALLEGQQPPPFNTKLERINGGKIGTIKSLVADKETADRICKDLQDNH